MVGFKLKGDFSNTERYLKYYTSMDRVYALLDKYGRQGVEALSKATPVDTGLTASSWYYKIIKTPRTITLRFYNSNIQNGIPIAIILQYGHATHNGGWVEGRDYINPAIQPIFDELAEKAWREVTKL